MIRYETVVLTVPEVTDDESHRLETQINKVVETNKGKVFAFDRWGKYRLAYPVRRNKYGVYFLARFEIPQDRRPFIAKELDDLFKLKVGNFVMRSILSALDPKASLEYKRPNPLDERPRDVNEFLKENKMTGLLKDSHPKSATNMEITAALEDIDQELSAADAVTENSEA